MDKPYIKKNFLRHGCYYTGKGRNSNIARWDENKQKFIYLRHKFGCTFLEEICHPDDDKVYDVFYPYELTDGPTEYINGNR